MPAKKALRPETPDHAARKKLDGLYAWRTTLDTLIHALEEYYQAKRIEHGKPKSV